MREKGTNAYWKILWLTAILMSVLFAVNTEAFADYDRSMVVPVKQTYVTDSTGVKGAFRYCLRSEDPDAPLPEGSKNGIYLFSMEGNTETELTVIPEKTGVWEYTLESEKDTGTETIGQSGIDTAGNSSKGGFACAPEKYRLICSTVADSTNHLYSVFTIQESTGEKTKTAQFTTSYQKSSGNAVSAGSSGENSGTVSKAKRLSVVLDGTEAVPAGADATPEDAVPDGITPGTEGGKRAGLAKTGEAASKYFPFLFLLFPGLAILVLTIFFHLPKKKREPDKKRRREKYLSGFLIAALLLTTACPGLISHAAATGSDAEIAELEDGEVLSLGTPSDASGSNAIMILPRLFSVEPVALADMVLLSSASNADWISDYTYDRNEEDGIVTLQKYNGSGTDLTIPGTVELDGKTYRVGISSASLEINEEGIWHDDNINLKSLSFGEGVLLPEECTFMFQDLTSLEYLDIRYFNFENVLDASDFITGDDKLISIEIPIHVFEGIILPDVFYYLDENGNILDDAEHTYTEVPQSNKSFEIVRAYNITYRFTGSIPTNEVLPEDNKKYIVGNSYNIDGKYYDGYTSLRQQMRVLFMGWKINDIVVENTETMGYQNVEIVGEWRMAQAMTNSFSIYNEIVGEYANKIKECQYRVNILTGEGVSYRAEKRSNLGSILAIYFIKDGEPFDFSLKNGEILYFGKNLPIDKTEYSVIAYGEKNYSKSVKLIKGTVDVLQENGNASENLEIGGTIISGDNLAEFTSTRNEVVPTGIHNDITPGAWILTLAMLGLIGFCILHIRGSWLRSDR